MSYTGTPTTLNALSANYPVAYYGWPVQYETFEDIASAASSGQLWNVSSGSPINDGKALLTWYAAVFRFRVSAGQNDGDTITLRWTRDGAVSESWMVWNHDERFWDTANLADPMGCVSGTVD